MRKSGEYIVDFVILILIAIFLLSYFKPEYIFSDTITTGGDTPSHYLTLKYLKENLAPRGKISGWLPGNFAGFPLFQFYFPLPFLTALFLNLFVCLPVAFKLITVIGIFTLPISTYIALRLFNYPFPAPVLGAIFTLPFLFMEANSMWGGNIPSTLAGEFAYSLGLSLMVLYTGTLFSGIKNGKYTIINGCILFLTGLAHGYTLLFAVIFSSFFLITTKNFLRNLLYLLKINTLAFCLLGFFIVPLLFFLPFTTPYNYVWVINSIFTVFPPILLPFILLAVLTTVFILLKIIIGPKQEKEHRLFYLWYLILSGLIFYFIAYRIGVVDIRFLPFSQFFLMIAGAISFFLMIKNLKGRSLIPFIALIFVILWVNYNVKFIPIWIKWNYTGFENK
ncbi:MAG: 6-pyruvoyl-tetrahydropterin synthase-related protein, partial [Thermodesulfobacteriota bacterium]|nr:6-pyruvoyl-tetrahydropterin synthase-related protein [Thermodesulfobacteriota bacterium]